MKAKAIIFDKDGTLFPYSIWNIPIRKFLSSEMPLSKLDEEEREKCIDEFSFVIGFNKDGSVNSNGLFIKKKYISTFFSLMSLTFKYHLNPIKSACGFLKIKHRCRYGYQDELKKHDFSSLRKIMGKIKNSGTSLAIFTNDTKESLDMFLTVFGKEYFSFSIDNSSLHKKPDIRTIKDYSLFSGINASEMMIVSDNIKDLKMAKKARVGTIVAISDTKDKKEKEKWADYIFPDLMTALTFFTA